MNIKAMLQTNQLFYFVPILLFFPQLYLSFAVILTNEAVWIDYLLLAISLIALIVSGIYGIKSTQKFAKALGTLYLVTSAGSLFLLLFS
jgi:hypothetical protein